MYVYINMYIYIGSVSTENLRNLSDLLPLEIPILKKYPVFLMYFKGTVSQNGGGLQMVASDRAYVREEPPMVFKNYQLSRFLF